MIPLIVTASCLAYFAISIGASVKFANQHGDSVLGLMLGLLWPFTVPLWGLYLWVEYLRLPRKKRAKLPVARVIR